MPRVVVEKIWNERGIGRAMGCESDRRAIAKWLFKATDCGAWIEFREGGISVGSIVEGVDWGTQVHELQYPFRATAFWRAIDAVEEEAAEIWDETHGCDDCGEENPETGYIHVNPECLTCNGYGTEI